MNGSGPVHVDPGPDSLRCGAKMGQRFDLHAAGGGCGQLTVNRAMHCCIARGNCDADAAPASNQPLRGQEDPA